MKVKLTPNHESNLEQWEVHHWTGVHAYEGQMEDYVVPVNPQGEEHDIWGAIAIKHPRHAVDHDWIPNANLQWWDEVNEVQISVWYVEFIRPGNKGFSKAKNLRLMVEACLQKATSGIIMDEIPNPNTAPTEWETDTLTLDEMKDMLNTHNNFFDKNHLARKFLVDGGKMLTEKKSQASKRNWAAAREASIVSRQETARAKAQKLMDYLDKGLSHNEISLLLKVSETSIPMMIHRAKISLELVNVPEVIVEPAEANVEPPEAIVEAPIEETEVVEDVSVEDFSSDAIWASLLSPTPTEKPAYQKTLGKAMGKYKK